MWFGELWVCVGLIAFHFLSFHSYGRSFTRALHSGTAIECPGFLRGSQGALEEEAGPVTGKTLHYLPSICPWVGGLGLETASWQVRDRLP